ncbi:MAG TPA: hypothetical protein ENL06_03545 [Candidatus Portnoybacteria bacterium]|nr:hypothetical protein [Candidatus Portnoybacteria bacterium]
MKLLGALGIDWRILIIQSINFLILFFILKKLFFRPLIQEIQKEKDETEQLKKDKENIIQEKEKWEEEKGKEILSTQAKIENMLARTEEMIRKNKEKYQEKEIEEEKENIQAIRKQAQSILIEYKKKFKSNYQEKIKLSLNDLLFKKLSPEIKIKIQDNFWPAFTKKTRKFNLSSLPQISQIKKRKETHLKKVKKDKKILVTISSAYPIEKSQELIIQNILEKSIPKTRMKIRKKRQINLIAGFQLEILGLLVEENLKEKIEKIFKKN